MKILSLLSVIFLSAVFWSASAESPYSLENLRKYDKLRIRVNQSKDYNGGVSSFLKLNGKNLYSKEATKEMEKKSTQAVQMQKKARLQKILSYCSLGAGLYLYYLSTPLITSGNAVGMSLIGEMMFIPAIIINFKSHKTNEKSYFKYENKLVNSLLKYKLPDNHKNTIPVHKMNPVNKYETYLSKTIRLGKCHSQRFNFSSIPLIMKGRKVPSNVKDFMKNTPEFAVNTRAYFKPMRRTEITSRILSITGVSSLFLTSISALGIVSSALNYDHDKEDFWTKTTIISGITTGATISIAIPLKIRYENKFRKGLSIYDRELREYYGIDELQ